MAPRNEAPVPTDRGSLFAVKSDRTLTGPHGRRQFSSAKRLKKNRMVESRQRDGNAVEGQGLTPGPAASTSAVRPEVGS